MTTLMRSLGLGTLVLYGVGDLWGAGIYAMVGKVVGMAASSAWISFLIFCQRRHHELFRRPNENILPAGEMKQRFLMRELNTQWSGHCIPKNN